MSRESKLNNALCKNINEAPFLFGQSISDFLAVHLKLSSDRK